MKLAFMGTPDFAVPVLHRLIESPHEVCLVVTQASKRQGRGQKVVDPPVKTMADEQGIRVLQPFNLRKEPIDDLIRELEIDILVVAAYGKILSASLLDAPKIGCINVHASLLPEYRGAAPIQRALIDGRHDTGVTIMEMVVELDAGPMMAQESLEIHSDDDARSLTDMLAVVGADLLLRVLVDVEKAGKIEGEPQDEDKVSYAERITKEEGWINWEETSLALMYRLRGLTPWPGLFTSVDKKRLRIVQAELLNDESASVSGSSGQFTAADDPEVVDVSRDLGGLDDSLDPGCVAGFDPEFGFIVRTGDGYLLVTSVQLEGKKEMDAPAFLRGTKLSVGQRLGYHRLV